MKPTWEALDQALNRFDAAKRSIWRAAGRVPEEGLDCDSTTFHTIKCAHATIAQFGYNAEKSIDSLISDPSIYTQLIDDLVEKATIVIRLKKLLGVGRRQRRNSKAQE